MAFKNPHANADPSPSRRGYWWPARGERVHLVCGGDELPIEWIDGNELKRRDGGRWWTPERSLALRTWTADQERAIAYVIASEAERDRLMMIKIELAWDRKARAMGTEPSPLPNPLPEATQRWVDGQRLVAEDLINVAIVAHPKLGGERPAWLTLRHAVARHESWLARAVELGVLPPPPMAEGRPILPVVRMVTNDADRMRAAEELARDMVGVR